MADHRFRFGVTGVPGGAPAEWLRLARRAEELGFSTLLSPDTTRTPAPLPALAAAAAVTERLHVGTWVLCEPLRNRRQLAWEAATLEQLSGGRFELGVGAGRPDAAADAAELGVPFGAPGERLAALRDTLALVRERLPDTRILIAAAGPRLLELAAQTADIVAFGWPPTTDIPAARERVDRVRAAAGGRDVELACGLIAVGAGEQPWLTRMGLDAGALTAAGAVTVLAGSPGEMADELQRRRDALGISYLTVPSKAIEQFAPVVEALAGR
jgi:probable F420-dependent oxidoreductase